MRESTEVGGEELGLVAGVGVGVYDCVTRVDATPMAANADPTLALLVRLLPLLGVSPLLL